jgi:hypothetical protein
MLSLVTVPSSFYDFHDPMLWIRLQIRKLDLGSGSPIPVWPPEKIADVLSGGLKASLTFRRPASRPKKKMIAFFNKTMKKMSNCELFCNFWS